MEEERCIVVRYTILRDGKLEYHTAYDLGLIEFINLASRVNIVEVVYEQTTSEIRRFKQTNYSII